MNQKKRPIGITLLAIFAGIAAFFAIIHTLQLLGLLPIPGPFGNVMFFVASINWIGAIMWGILAVIYIWVVKMLWSLDARGWLFLVILSILNLILIGISLLGQTTWQAVLPSLLINALILIYCLLPGTKDAFLPQEEAQSRAPQEEALIHESKTAVAKPEEETASAATVENVDIEAETAAVAATIAATEAEPAPEPEPTSAPEPVVEEAPIEDSEPVAAVVDNVDIKAETAVAAAAIAATETDSAEEVAEEESLPVPPAENIEVAAHASRGEEIKFGSESEFIEGIGPAYSAKLQEIGIDSPQTLLEAGATPAGRKELVEKTGISQKLIMKWLNAADLYRIKGIGSQYAELLVTAGVNTVLELAQRNPENLHKKLVEVNEEKHHVREVPSQNMVTSWVEQAKELPRVLHY